MPKLWDDTIEAHRRAVRDAAVDATATLVARRGLRGVTMSRVAEEAGIGRATLYKYFRDVESILLAWHERQISAHLALLAQTRDNATDDAERLEAVLEAYALLVHQSRGPHDGDLAALLHADDQVGAARAQLHAMVRELVAEAAKTGSLRDDVAVDELASYCLHALGAAGTLRSKAAVRRLVAVTLAGMRHPD